MYTKDLEELIDGILADGVITANVHKHVVKTLTR